MQELIWLAVMFVGTFTVTTLLLALWRWTRRPPILLDPDAPSRPLLGEWSEALASQLPMPNRARVAVEQSLRAAGFYRPTALIDYAAVRSLAVLSAVIGTALTLLVVPTDQARFVLLAGVTLAILGFSIPRFYVMILARRRSLWIMRGLPFAVDLLAMTLSAGQNTLQGLEHVSQELAVANPPLAEELQIVQRQAALSTLAHALEQFANRVAVPQVRNLALLLMQAERLGSDVSAALQEFSTHFRATMRQQAEAQANRTTFWMTFPSVCCLWLSATIVLVGPLYQEFWRQWGQSAQTARDANSRVRTVAGQPIQPPGPPVRENPILP